MLMLYVYVRNWLESLAPEEGQDLIEYALLVALIALFCVLAITAGGQAISTVWKNIATALGTLPTGAAP